jgi:hypothetical protein
MELLQKLKIKPDLPLWLINAPDGCMQLFAGLTIMHAPVKNKQAGQLMLFVTSREELEHYLVKMAVHIGHETLFWICYPKKSGAIASDLVLMKSWDSVFMAGYRGQTSVSINDDWSGLRVTNAPREKPSIADVPMEERKIEGIDFVKRTVKLPDDATQAMNEYKGLAACFDSLSFTSKKEYVVAIIEAKKQETRERRIEKMISELQQKMHTRGTNS